MKSPQPRKTPGLVVRKVGSLEGAIASLVALGQLKREREQEPQYYGGA